MLLRSTLYFRVIPRSLLNPHQKKKKTTTTLPEIPPAGLYFDQKLGLPDKLKPCKKELAKSILRTWSHWRQSFAPENWWLERWSFPFLAISTYFQGQKVGFKECNAVEGFWFMAWGPHVGMFFFEQNQSRIFVWRLSLIFGGIPSHGKMDSEKNLEAGLLRTMFSFWWYWMSINCLE